VAESLDSAFKARLRAVLDRQPGDRGFPLTRQLAHREFPVGWDWTIWLEREHPP